MSIINNCSSVRYYVWQLRSAILLAHEMTSEWIPTFFKYFYAGIVQSNLYWKIHNKYVFHVNIHNFVLKYLVQIQIIQNQFKISEGGKWNSHQMPCNSSRMVKQYRICPIRIEINHAGIELCKFTHGRGLYILIFYPSLSLELKFEYKGPAHV